MAKDDIVPRRDHLGRWSRVPDWPLRRRVTPLSLLVAAGLVAYAWIDATAAPFSTRALVGVLIPGVVLGAIAYRRPPQRIPPPQELDAIGFSYWVIAVVALFEWEASAYSDNSRYWHPSLTNLINPMLEPHMMKSAAILAWIMAGWGLVKR